jgi:TatD DNase family protein
MRLFDAHCHLQDDRLMARLNFALERAADTGIEGIMCCGTSEEDWTQVADLSPSRPYMLRSFGLHPSYVKESSPNWKQALIALLCEQASGVGEIGLDHAIEDRNDREQEEAFLAQLQIARELDRPVSIHCRRAWDRMLALLGSFGKHGPGIVIHSYSGTAELVKPLAELGVYFSFSGSITRETNERGRAAVQVVPLDRLLIETDAPDLMPVLPADETRDLNLDHPVNEPANLVFILHKVAELRQIPAMDVAEHTWENANRLFANAMPAR